MPKLESIWDTGSPRARPAVDRAGGNQMWGIEGTPQIHLALEKSPHTGSGIRPNPRALPMQQGRERLCWDQGTDERHFSPPLLANIIVLCINTKCQNVSQLHGRLASAQNQADERQRCSVQR